MKKLFLVAAALAAPMAVTPASARVIDLQPYVNSNVSNYTNGGNYPSGTTTIGGIGFGLATFDGGTGVIQLGSGLPTVNVGLTAEAADTVYIIMNSAYGRFGFNNGSINFVGSTGTRSFDIVQGTNVRDHFNGGGNNTATDLFATVDYNNSGARFDAYRYDVSGLGLLTSVNFTYRNDENGNGLPFVAGITTAQEAAVDPVDGAVPEPATWAMMLVGFGMVGFGLRSRRKPSVRVTFA